MQINAINYYGNKSGNKLKGQSIVEYLVICTALAAALGIGMADKNSVLWQLINAFQIAYKNFSFALSIPA